MLLPNKLFIINYLNGYPLSPQAGRSVRLLIRRFPFWDTTTRKRRSRDYTAEEFSQSRSASVRLISEIAQKKAGQSAKDRMPDDHSHHKDADRRNVLDSLLIGR
jgi:hypothetical protein